SYGGIEIERTPITGDALALIEFEMEIAIATSSYTVDGIAYLREAFVSPVDGVLVLRLSADRKRAISCRISIDSPQQGEMRIGQGSQ
ncbi:glycoside hydrolase N-terminal domain-containing protein, partial [Rhizobium johnstonii]|uniref:glycoside hydrolase N-terminal domain-containing protein n=1 Tax=Rhizobium johnstonii TaxID=3019933 RepID=UPI003F97BD15